MCSSSCNGGCCGECGLWSPGIKAYEFNYHLTEGAPLAVGTWSRASVEYLRGYDVIVKSQARMYDTYILDVCI